MSEEEEAEEGEMNEGTGTGDGDRGRWGHEESEGWSNEEYCRRYEELEKEEEERTRLLKLKEQARKRVKEEQEDLAEQTMKRRRVSWVNLGRESDGEDH